MSFFGVLKAFTDVTYNFLRQDKSTHALLTIDYAHHEVHGGSEYRIIATKEVAASGTMVICFTVPDTTKWPHMLMTVTSTSEARIQFQEDITSFTGGAAITPRNANRNSVKTSGVVDMALDPTPTVGTPVELFDFYIGVAGTNKIPQSAQSNEERGEWVLKQNTKYYFLITNEDGDDPNRVNVMLNWYEHTDKENPF